MHEATGLGSDIDRLVARLDRAVEAPGVAAITQGVKSTLVLSGGEANIETGSFNPSSMPTMTGRSKTGLLGAILMAGFS